MAALALDLVVLALNLTVWGIGISELDELSRLWDNWGKPISLIGIWLLLFAAAGFAIAFSYCLNYQNQRTREAAKIIGAALIGVCLLRLMMGVNFSANVCDCSEGGYCDQLGPPSLWPTWWYWASLPARWCVEVLLLTFLAYLASDWRHEETVARVYWVGGLLIVEFWMQGILFFAGIVGECHSWLVRVHQFDEVQAGLIVCAPMLAVRLAVMSQLFRALLAARHALVGGVGPAYHEGE
ncbi:MAG: hypothetical protein U0797_22390 [Gemmataceae bacterium]